METLQRTANRGSISTGYDITNSLKLEEDNSEYLERATGGGNGSTTQHTISVWVKRTEITKTSFILGFAGIGRLRFESDDKIEYQFRSGRKLETNRLFRDTSAWYHIVVVADSTLATSTDRMKLYINGVRETDLLTYIPQDQNQGSPAWGVYNTYNYRIGYSGTAGENFNGYIADAYYINGQTLDPTDFGEFDEDSGIWKPKAFTGTFGSLDNYLDFSNSSNLGEDANGGTDLSLNNITSADQATDTPTNNFATWNVNYNYTNSNGNPTITEGATKTAESSGGWTQAKATMGVTSGKWYWEYKMGGSISFMGVQDDTASQTEFAGQYSLLLYNGDTTVEINDTGSLRDDTVLSYTFSTSNIYAVALNMDDNEISYYQNGSIIGSAISLDGLSDRLLLPYIGTHSSTNETNFGGYTTISISSAATDANGYGTFEYAPPSGYYALCTKNLAEYG